MADMDSNGEKRQKRKCAHCRSYYYIGKNDEPKAATYHHLVFTSDGLVPTEKPEFAGDQIETIRRFRNVKNYAAILCMTNTKNGNGKDGSNYGCHNAFNDQIINGCCGIDNIGLNGKVYVVIGICPLITNKSPRDPILQIPNSLCEFCFYFNAIFSVDEYMPLMEIITKSSHYNGFVTRDSLVIAKNKIQRSGLRAKKISTNNGVRWQPILNP
ncbi:hypothetical protein COX95_01490 [bacterium CG_4_10_14_0_2_um_filter_33_32]|nr:MAG: hypothetical protein AUJ93_03805 [bacterium CG2_30_33_46]PIR67415.1 MAG: hypothetical protein COU50_03375 [bacterium CG10_big_fil_rev_8_21_14_0_10_33_18]PIU76303.1 MAG: hypothetical protein COS74_04755 [bacterium CG06_land_8_20_14_3_00_33_50]PIY85746.1 MAG: hypothetical protein COY76_00555 [bacterium CG_4_10_14_0_8_um_filter_33_57]PIZ86373.1 MAG: hypothetical protein COX95_01490 [bacterium CG_4_10_14_0_2_um_filter_33_32]PJA72637.1 MAG: hypothetical protein CO152_00370 [bacterium CG_4_9